MLISKVNQFAGEVHIPGDKSISHRCIMLASLAEGVSRIRNFLSSADCISTLTCFQQLGVKIQHADTSITIYGKGLYGLKEPRNILNVNNSGTTLRLMSGILSGQPFTTQVTGDESIQKRPMGRVMSPLREMGATIHSIKENNCAPIEIKGTNKPLNGLTYHSPIASAQVKSAILLAGLYADTPTTVIEPSLSRNHTEIMLKHFGGQIHTHDTSARLVPGGTLCARDIEVPGDISSAAYFIGAASVIPHANILLRNVGINPTRAGIIDVCKEMGGNISLENVNEHNGELTGDIRISSASLKGITIEGDLIPTLIDEIPIIAIMAAYASGTTYIKDASELRVKETDRIQTIVTNLNRMGGKATATEDGLIIEGGFPLEGAVIESYHDHRIAMAFSIAGMVAEGETEIRNSQCVDISYPNFYQDLQKLSIE